MNIRCFDINEITFRHNHANASKKEKTEFEPVQLEKKEIVESNDDSIVLRIRELNVSHFASKGLDYKIYSGGMIWDASVVLARWIFENPILFQDKDILELGSGCGVAGILCSYFGKKVILSDYLQPILDNLTFNAEQNMLRKPSQMQVISFNWETVDTKNFQFDPVDIIIGAEITYEEEHAQNLINVLNVCLKPSGTFYEIAEEERPGLNLFIRLLQQQGFLCTVLPISQEFLQPWEGERELDCNKYCFLVAQKSDSKT